METVHRTAGEIEAALPDILTSPQDQGVVRASFVRPTVDGRERLEAAHLSPESGVEGDRWVESGEPRLSDGRPDPRSQVTLMNARFLRWLAGSEERMSLAGDNLVVDLDLGAANLPVGQKIAAGTAVLEITDMPHTGCAKFAERFGRDAMRLVNARENDALHLRGRYARILQAGMVHVGDAVYKVAGANVNP